MSQPGLSRFRSQRGSIVLVALGFTAVMAIATAGFLTACYRSMQLSNRAFNGARSIQFAEMGMEEALWSLKNNDWSGWTIQGSTASRTIAGFTYSDGCSGEIHLRLQNYNTTQVSLIVEGQTTLADGSTVRKQLVATASQAPVFTNAIFSSATTIFDEGGTVDSYNSADGPYSAGTAGYSAVVAGSSFNSFTVGSVMVNQANIHGYVAYAGLTPVFGVDGALKGPTTPAMTRIDSSRVNTSPWQNFPDIRPVTGGSALPSGSIAIGTAGAALPSVYYTRDLNLTEGTTITVNGPVVLDLSGALSTDNSGAGIIVTATGSLEIHWSGNMALGGAGIVNQTHDPKKVVLLCSASSNDFGSHVYSMTAPFYGVLYMPDSGLWVSGNVQLHGAIITQTVKFAEGANPQFHYDTALRSPAATFAGLAAAFQLTNWREITDPVEMAQF